MRFSHLDKHVLDQLIVCHAAIDERLQHIPSWLCSGTQPLFDVTLS